MAGDLGGEWSTMKGDRGGSSLWVLCRGSCSACSSFRGPPRGVPRCPASDKLLISLRPLIMPLVCAPCDTIFTRCIVRGLKVTGTRPLNPVAGTSVCVAWAFMVPRFGCFSNVNDSMLLIQSHCYSIFGPLVVRFFFTLTTSISYKLQFFEK